MKDVVVNLDIIWPPSIGTEVSLLKLSKMVVSSVFHDFPDLERLEALVDSENLRSQRVLEKVGFTGEGFLRKYLIVKGSSRDIVMYSLLSADLKS
uniref:N-acetyltransferase domain-containing protein n=1 Tax=Nelumbo nucifera TaxID=4432 RepID=A0A822ZPJ3_NELNU|nr:TPA_asm: hypothetical protein HUJ06_017831 [Nelumbo nucifera]